MLEFSMYLKKILNRIDFSSNFDNFKPNSEQMFSSYTRTGNHLDITQPEDHPGSVK